MSPLDQSLLLFAEIFQSAGIRTMVGGSIAAMLYGEARSTIDIDLIIDANSAEADRIIKAFEPSRYHVPPREALTKALRSPRDGSFQILDRSTGLKADVYVAGSDPLIRYGLDHSRLEPLHGREIRVAPATYVIAMKLRYYAMSEQSKHLRDVRTILELSPDQIDFTLVRQFAKECGALAAWEACVAAPGSEED